MSCNVFGFDDEVVLGIFDCDGKFNCFGFGGNGVIIFYIILVRFVCISLVNVLDEFMLII